MSLRWIARVCSLIGMFFLVGLFNSDTINALDGFGWILFMTFPCILLSGYILSWMYDNTGAIVSLSTLSVYYLLHYLFKGNIPEGTAILFFAVPPILFIVSRFFSKKKAVA